MTVWEWKFLMFALVVVNTLLGFLGGYVVGQEMAKPPPHKRVPDEPTPSFASGIR